ncbi:hypothetical protein C8R45DRAFT_1133161 [Mycena sanguinolenta]|nr:hypothetical protein C8R45DRAFT_1133161 [Mycena sanguinolenta]
MLVLALASSLVVHTTTFLYFLVIPVNAHLFANDSRPLRALPSFSQPMTEHGLTTSHTFRFALALSDAPLAYQRHSYTHASAQNPALLLVIPLASETARIQTGHYQTTCALVLLTLTRLLTHCLPPSFWWITRTVPPLASRPSNSIFTSTVCIPFADMLFSHVRSADSEQVQVQSSSF